MLQKSFFFCLWICFSRGVFGADTDEVKSVSVTEGDSVSLNTDVQVQKDNQILWAYRLHSSETRIAEIYKRSIDMFDSNVTFGHRLQIDSQTGSLTIRNIRSTDSGLYKLSIISKTITHKSFNVTVYAPLQIPVITRDSSDCSSSSERSSVSRCSLLCSSVLNVSDVTLSWYKGMSVLSSISASNISISLSLPLDVEYQDKNNYSCVINNPVTHQTTHLDNITKLCHTCAELVQSSHWVGKSISLVFLALLVVAAVTICLRRKSKPATQAVQSSEEDVLYAETRFCAHSVHSTKANGEDHIIYSGVNVT